MRWDAKSGVKLYLKPAGYTGKDPRGGESGSNGLTLDRKGRLILCQHGDRRVARLDSSWDNPQPKYVTLADRYDGKRFNSPNDAVVAFQRRDLLHRSALRPGKEHGRPGQGADVPRRVPHRARWQGDAAHQGLERPNGIALSPDEKTLYVANSHGPRPIIMAFPVKADGTLGEGREFFNARELIEATTRRVRRHDRRPARQRVRHRPRRRRDLLARRQAPRHAGHRRPHRQLRIRRRRLDAVHLREP